MAETKIIRPHTVEPVLLSALASRMGLRHEGPDGPVTGLSVHTDLLVPGDLFVAVPGAKAHGISYWKDAKDHGATAVLTDEAGWAQWGDSTVPTVIAPAPREILGKVAAAIYQTSDLPLPVCAVTGTNGKTSTAFLLEALRLAHVNLLVDR